MTSVEDEISLSGLIDTSPLFDLGSWKGRGDEFWKEDVWIHWTYFAQIRGWGVDRIERTVETDSVEAKSCMGQNS